MTDQPRKPDGRFGETPRGMVYQPLEPDQPLAENRPGAKKHLISNPDRLTASEMRMLLDDLDSRLRDRGVAASVYIVGGAAIALSGDREQLTADVDAISDSAELWEESRALAEDYGIATGWMNQNAKPYIPPRPPEALVEPTEPGLTEHMAPPEHLLAMKMVALRPKDRPDIGPLVERLGMQDAEPEDFADLLSDVFSAEDGVASALSTPGADPEQARVEAVAIGRQVVAIADEARRRRLGDS